MAGQLLSCGIHRYISARFVFERVKVKVGDDDFDLSPFYQIEKKPAFTVAGGTIPSVQYVPILQE